MDKNYSKSVERVSLHDKGFTTCRDNSDIAIFKTHLDLIHEGKLIDSAIDDGEINNYVESLKKEVHKHESDIEANNNKIKFIEDEDIPKWKEKINILKKEIEDIMMGKTIHTNFNTVKFAINLVILLAVTTYLYFFYAGVVDGAFNPPSIDEICEGSDDLLGGAFAGKTFSQLLLNSVSPFVFFGFGYAIHSILEQKKNIKYLYTLLLVGITFVLDFYLSKRIYEQVTNVKIMQCGEDPSGLPPFMESDQFKIVLMLGFVVFIVWSILLHALLEELKKKDIIGLRKKAIENFEKEIDQFEKVIRKYKEANDNFTAKIKQLNLEIENRKPKPADIKHSLFQFKAGWLECLVNNRWGDDMIANAEKVFEENLIRYKLKNE